jgi:hypothetical protein
MTWRHAREPDYFFYLLFLFLILLILYGVKHEKELEKACLLHETGRKMRRKS